MRTPASNSRPVPSVPRRPEKVLVLGDGVSAFLAVIRSLGRQGIEVHVAWCQTDCPALRSRYVKRFHVLPCCDPAGTWVGRLAEVLDTERYDLVLPTNEQSMRALQSHRREFESRSRLCLLDEPVFDVVFDKVKCGQLAANLGLRVPRTCVVTDLAALEGLESQFAYPLVLKPISSYDAQSPLKRRNVVKAYNRDELQREGRRLLGEGTIAVQENFVGRGVGVELLVDHGEVLLAFQHERIHQPSHGGASSYRKSVPLDAVLLDAATRFVAALDYSGAVMIEFLVNPSGDDWRFVEVNGRFWGSLPLAIAAGADFPSALYRLWVHGERNFRQEYRTDLYCRNLLADALWYVQNLRADRNDPTLATMSPLKVLLEAKHFLAGRERFDTLTLDDPLPAVAEPLKYARRLMGRFALRARQAWVSLPGIRQCQYSRTSSMLERARCVVFICWGNICRSPFAAAYARRVWPAEIQVLSRGLHHQQGRLSPADAVDAARRYDIALDEHRSSVISEKDIAGADMIICFDELIRKELLDRFPHARPKAFRFGVLCPHGQVAVADPFGGSVSAFCDAYAQIKETLDASCALFDGASLPNVTLSSDRQATATGCSEDS
jgi:protein-tyrosine-phosphatase/predicted ATP-grasp superfamily ATP-dependent carboligase